MTKVSKMPLSDEKTKALINNLWSAMTLMQTKDDIRLLFKDLFTRTESKMIAKRLEAARQLLSDASYDEIQKNLKMTSTTIAYINNILQTNGGGYRKAHEELKAVERKKQTKIVERQDRLERRTRPKLSGETVLFDAAVAGIKKISSVLKSKRRNDSANESLPL